MHTRPHTDKQLRQKIFEKERNLVSSMKIPLDRKSSSIRLMHAALNTYCKLELKYELNELKYVQAIKCTLTSVFIYTYIRDCAPLLKYNSRYK